MRGIKRKRLVPLFFFYQMKFEETGIATKIWIVTVHYAWHADDPWYSTKKKEVYHYPLGVLAHDAAKRIREAYHLNCYVEVEVEEVSLTEDPLKEAFGTFPCGSVMFVPTVDAYGAGDDEHCEICEAASEAGRQELW